MRAREASAAARNVRAARCSSGGRLCGRPLRCCSKPSCYYNLLAIHYYLLSVGSAQHPPARPPTPAGEELVARPDQHIPWWPTLHYGAAVAATAAAATAATAAAFCSSSFARRF